MKSALVVAHADDESLFFGGLLASEPGDWTVICCSIARADPIRSYKFFDACEVLGAKGRLLPFAEALLETPHHLNKLDLSGFDRIVTHGAAGEYGHAHHKIIHRHITSKWISKPIIVRGTTRRLILTDEQRALKLAALRCYDHVSPDDGKPKWQALLAKYPEWIDVESYDERRP